jgi:hypothetical protein
MGGDGNGLAAPEVIAFGRAGANGVGGGYGGVRGAGMMGGPMGGGGVGSMEEKVVVMESMLRSMQEEQALHRNDYERRQWADLMQGRLFGAPGEGLAAGLTGAGSAGAGGYYPGGVVGESGKARQMMAGYEMAMGSNVGG